MKLSEIARYWAAKELTSLTRTEGAVALRPPYACPGFTVEIENAPAGKPFVVAASAEKPLNSCGRLLDLAPGLFYQNGKSTSICFDLSKGESTLRWRQ